MDRGRGQRSQDERRARTAPFSPVALIGSPSCIGMGVPGPNAYRLSIITSTAPVISAEVMRARWIGGHSVGHFYVRHPRDYCAWLTEDM